MLRVNQEKITEWKKFPEILCGSQSIGGGINLTLGYRESPQKDGNADKFLFDLEKEFLPTDLIFCKAGELIVLRC